MALDQLPQTAAGLPNHEANDRELQQIANSLFVANSPKARGGIYLPDYKIGSAVFNPGRQPWKPTPPLDGPQLRLLGLLRATDAARFFPDPDPGYWVPHRVPHRVPRQRRATA